MVIDLRQNESLAYFADLHSPPRGSHMAVGKAGDAPPAPPPGAVDAGRGGTPIRPLYGVFIRDTVLPDAKSKIATTLSALNATIKGGSLQGAQLADAQSALTDLNNALAALGGAPGPMQPPTTRPQPLYGIFMRETLPQIKKEISGEAREINQGIKSKAIPDMDAAEAGKALAALQQAEKALAHLGNLKGIQ